MPDSPDVIVIGGGVIGLSAAWRLRQPGAKVVLVERGAVGQESSWAGAGMLVPPSPHRRTGLSALIRESMALYPAFAQELHSVSGIDIEYERCGRIEICPTEQKYRMGLAKVRAAAEHAGAGEPELEMLDMDAVRRIEPAIHCDAPGALLCHASARLRNTRLLAALRAACDHAGVQILEDWPVERLQLDGERVTGVAGPAGALSAATVVLCAGAWSSQLHPALETLAPVFPSRGQAVLLHMPDPPFERLIERSRTYLVRRRDGHIYLGATDEPDAGFDKHVTPAGVGGLMYAALQMVPGLAGASVVGMWSGLRPRTPDRRPYLGAVPGLDGLIAATGHYRNGILLAPLTGEIVCELVIGGKSLRELSSCRPGRAGNE